jgi:hypothetical protein
MSDFASLKSTLKRGALITAANWPVVVVQFVAESTFKLLLGVPVVGGVLLVGLALGRDVDELLRGSPREVATSVAGTLVDHPGAFAAFVLSTLLVVLGGSALTFLVKGGTVSVLVRGASIAGPVERPPLRLAAVKRATAFSVTAFADGSAYLFRRYLRLGLILLGAYAVSGGVYLAAVIGTYRLAQHESGLMVAWTLFAALASSVLVVWISIVNLVYLLVQMIVAAEDTSVRRAARRLASFVRRELRSVTLVFLVLLGLVGLATLASMLATAGLSLVSFVPLVGLAVFPLQAGAWLVRGLVFQYLGLTALAAYLSLYMPRDSASADAVRPAWARTAS